MKYEIDTTFLSDFEKENFENILFELEYIGCIITEKTIWEK